MANLLTPLLRFFSSLASYWHQPGTKRLLTSLVLLLIVTVTIVRIFYTRRQNNPSRVNNRNPVIVHNTNHIHLNNGSRANVNLPANRPILSSSASSPLVSSSSLSSPSPSSSSLLSSSLIPQLPPRSRYLLTPSTFSPLIRSPSAASSSSPSVRPLVAISSLFTIFDSNGNLIDHSVPILSALSQHTNLFIIHKISLPSSNSTSSSSPLTTPSSSPSLSSTSSSSSSPSVGLSKVQHQYYLDENSRVLGILNHMGLMDCGFKSHRLLLCNSTKGKGSIYRHLEPHLIVDDDRETLTMLKQHVNDCVLIAPKHSFVSLTNGKSLTFLSFSTPQPKSPLLVVPNIECYFNGLQQETMTTESHHDNSLSTNHNQFDNFSANNLISKGDENELKFRKNAGGS